MYTHTHTHTHNFFSKNKFSCFLIIFLTFLNYNCKDSNLEPQIKPNLFDFYGVKIDLVKSGDKAEDLQNFIDNDKIEIKSRVSRLSIEDKNKLSSISASDFLNILKSSLKKFPDLNKDTFSNSEMEFFRYNIPEIKSTQIALDKKDALAEYIDFKASLEIKKEIKNYTLKGKGSKKNGIIDDLEALWGTLNEYERDFCIIHAGYAICIYNATFDAINACNELYYLNVAKDNLDQVNAVKHAVWNACSVGRCANYSKNKWKALERTKQYTCAHEYQPDVNGFMTFVQTPTVAMDLFNNLAGRTYAYNKIGQTWLGNANNIPSYNTVKTEIGAMVKNQRTTVNDIFTVGLNGNLSWPVVYPITNAYDYSSQLQGKGLVYLQ